MKIKCNQNILSKALITVNKAVTSRTTIPILKGILIEAIDEQTIKLAASDLDISIEKKIEAKVQGKGSIVIASKLFIDIIRKLPNEEIELEEIDGTIKIKCKSSEFTIVSQQGDEFPNISDIEEKQRLIIDKEMFKKMIKRTSFAASIDEARGVLTGVLLEIKENSFHMVALDGFRMAIARENIHSNIEKKVIISARILNEINKILMEDEKEEEFIFILDDKKAVIMIGDVKVTCRLLEGEFVNYGDIMPKESKIICNVDKKELQESIERASLIVKEGKNNLIKINIQENIGIITSKSEEGNVKEEVALIQQGDNIEIGFNSKYIIDVLKAMEDQHILMKFNTNVSPCIVTAEETDEFEYLILPVRISNN